MADKVKFTVAALLVIAGLAAFYLLPGSPTVVRFGCILAGIAAGTAVAWFTVPGQQFLAYARESVVEVKKVAWPTRRESLQTTGAVFAFVFVMAVFLWISDKSLEFLLYDLILDWK